MSAYFEYPWLLLAAAVPVPLFILLQRRVRDLLPVLEELIAAHGGFPMARKLLRMTRLRSFCFMLSWTALVCAVAGPHCTAGQSLEPSWHSDHLVLVFDISRSMTVDDIRPTRLEFAARYAAMLLEQIPGIPVGIVLVKGDAVLAVPLTDDRQSLLALIDNLSPDLMTAAGTDLGAGIMVAARSFPSARGGSGAIAVFTDGGETVPTLRPALLGAVRAGNTVSIVGIGTITGVPVSIYPGQDDGPQVQTVLEEAALLRAVQAAGPAAQYVAAVDASSARRVLTHLFPENTSITASVGTSSGSGSFNVFLLVCVLSAFAGVLAGGIKWAQ